jgi:hypothetical protein
MSLMKISFGDRSWVRVALVVFIEVSCAVPPLCWAASSASHPHGSTWVSGLNQLTVRLWTPGTYLGIDVALKEILPSTEYDV